MSVRAIISSLYAALVFLMLVLAGLMYWVMQNQYELNEGQATRYLSYLLADELRQSSDDLTRLARTYVSTGESKHEDQYWEILDIRNGKKARPDGRTVALKQLMKDAGFTEREFAKLTEAENNSNSLV